MEEAKNSIRKKNFFFPWDPYFGRKWKNWKLFWSSKTIVKHQKGLTTYQIDVLSSWKLYLPSNSKAFCAAKCFVDLWKVLSTLQKPLFYFSKALSTFQLLKRVCLPLKNFQKPYLHSKKSIKLFRPFKSHVSLSERRFDL